MPRRRRARTITSALVIATTLAVAGCSGNSGGGASSTSSSTSSSTTQTTAPTESSPTLDVYAINCHLISQQVVDGWTKGGEPASVEETDQGCRVVSSDPEGALMVQWRYLDTDQDQGLVREVSKGGTAVEIEEGVTAVRSESDVDPTRMTRLYVTFDNARTMYAEATATLDRPRTMADLEEMTSTVVKTYSDQPPLPSLPDEPESSSD